jgi:TetR/AcrR family transcriptional regulator
VSFAIIYEPLISLLKRGIEKGVFRPDMDPSHCATNIVGMCVFYFCVRNNLRHLFPPGTDMLGPDMLKAHLKESVALMLTGIRMPCAEAV